MANNLLPARRASPGPATPSSPRFPVSTGQLSPTSRVRRSNSAWFGVFVVALGLVMLLVLWAPASLLLSLALLVAVVGVALLAAVVGAVRNAWRCRLSRR